MDVSKKLGSYPNLQGPLCRVQFNFPTDEVSLLSSVNKLASGYLSKSFKLLGVKSVLSNGRHVFESGSLKQTIV